MNKSNQQLPREMFMDTAKLEDAKSMLELNYKIYPKEWHVPEDYVAKVLAKNAEVYRVLRTREGIKGIYSLFPLKKDPYEKVLKGELSEDEIFSYLEDYSNSKEIYIYFISLIVDIFDPFRKKYVKKLLQDIPTRLEFLRTKGIEIQEIGAIAISEEGKRICSRIGFRNTGETLEENDKVYPIYRAKPEDLIQAIKIE